MAKVLINITSYDRRELLLNLLEELKGEDIIVWDDNSNFNIEGEFYFYKFHKNYGKKQAWIKYRQIFRQLKSEDYDYFIFIPDDVELCCDFVNKSIKLFQKIKDEKKICLSLLSDVRIKKQCWTGIDPLIKGNVILTQWSDLCFICTSEFFKEVNIKPIAKDRWDENHKLSSGVGAQISRQLYAKGLNQYHSIESLVIHRKGISKMNHYE